MEHAYPHHLADLVMDEWEKVDPSITARFVCSNGECDMPPREVLHILLSTAYQASLMLDEGRFVIFRILLCNPEVLPEHDGPPYGLHRLVFTNPVPFDPHEIRRLSQAIPFQRSLIGVRYDSKEGLKIWGCVHSGPRWLRTLQGGRGTPPPMPPSLVITAGGPGQLEISRGASTVGQLRDGHISGSELNIFASRWLPEYFESTRTEYLQLHEAEKALIGQNWGDLDADVTRVIGQNMVKRMIAAMRSYKHGGILIWVPDELAAQLQSTNPYLDIKYQFSEGEPRARFRTLMVKIMNALADSGSRSIRTSGQVGYKIGWREYERSTEKAISELDESVFEMSHLVASLSTIDGAVVLTRRFELLGFGAEIFCDRAEVVQVAKALDLEGSQVEMEGMQGVGTRHRAAYRLCNVLKTALVIVVSQDGNARAVRWKDGCVTYWDHQAATSSFTL